MDDLISRQAVIEINRSYHGQMPNEVNHRIWKEINELPSAQPEVLACGEGELSAQPQRKKGKWINHRCDDGHHIADCDQCGHSLQWFDDDIPKYCCECGADMREDGDADGC